MKPRNVLGVRACAELFDRAVQERALAVLNVQGSEGWATFKSRFLERDPRGRFVDAAISSAKHPQEELVVFAAPQ